MRYGDRVPIWGMAEGYAKQYFISHAFVFRNIFGREVCSGLVSFFSSFCFFVCFWFDGKKVYGWEKVWHPKVTLFEGTGEEDVREETEGDDDKYNDEEQCYLVGFSYIFNTKFICMSDTLVSFHMDYM